MRYRNVRPGIQMFTIDLKTGASGPVHNIWNGTGASAPEGPHIYKKDTFYYLLIAEGGTGSGHMVTMARAKNISGPYESYQQNPVLTNGGEGFLFQNLGHADLFQDERHKWWAVALSVRQAPDGSLFPYFRVRGITTVPAFVSPTIAQIPVPKRWRTKSLSFGIEATSLTHYAMSVAPTGEEKERIIVGYANGLGLTWGFTGALLGVYATTNGAQGNFSASNLVGHVQYPWETRGSEAVSCRARCHLEHESANKPTTPLQNVYKVMNSRSSSIHVPRPSSLRRPSVTSRLSFAISNAEQGEANAAVSSTEHQIVEEIDEIKRYEDFTTIGKLSASQPQKTRIDNN
ncbi:putative Xylosidase/arabinosidase [Glarea lozoyensis 74030]|uniref:Putative Xylosidase/arabinosidase n=1 Tax=Glarea lozoyensis (strain ATCC 74030 / MF5533) TaxID=1104152 RepID=H0ES95_GLAL7|nr:putative Xylosidase/arabinosidase [Glarea lozoyensis 74030]